MYFVSFYMMQSGQSNFEIEFIYLLMYYIVLVYNFEFRCRRKKQQKVSIASIVFFLKQNKKHNYVSMIFGLTDVTTFPTIIIQCHIFISRNAIKEISQISSVSLMEM